MLNETGYPFNGTTECILWAAKKDMHASGGKGERMCIYEAKILVGEDKVVTFWLVGCQGALGHSVA